MGAPPSRDRFHVAGEDLTAFAHGELPEWRRAEVSRHVLGCEPCRRSLAASRDVLSLLGEVGRFGIESLRAELAARRPARAARLLRRVATAASVAAVVALGVLLAPPRGPAPAPGGGGLTPVASAAEVPLTPDQRALVAAQHEDGRWAAEASFGGPRRDEAATALALLALLPRDADALRSGPAARAVADGVRWLVTRGGAARAERDPGPDLAVATCALLEVYALSPAPDVRAPLHDAIGRAIRRLSRGLPHPFDDVERDPSLGWRLRALATARALGWGHLDAAIDGLRAADADLDGSLTALARVAPPDAPPDSPCALALRVLRERAES
jgi:hypothetical protein